MQHPSRIPFAFRASSPLAVAVAFFLGLPAVSDAGLTLVSSSGSISYGVYSTSNGSGPSFVNNMLVNPGGGLPVLGSLTSTSQSATASSLSPSFALTATTNPNSPTGFVPSNFGTATTQIYTASSGNRGGFTTQGGIYWTSNTGLADGLTPGAGFASVSFSTASATFVNNMSTAISFTPGALLSITGTLGGADGKSYIAAGLSSSYTINDGESTSTSPLDSIILATNKLVTINSTGTNINEYASISVLPGLKVSGAGTSLSNSIVTLGVGQSITISSALTLISDPGSSINISTDLPSGFPTDPQFLPDFGVAANSAPVAAVPEPSTIVLMGSGLAIAGLWSRSSRRKSKVQAA